MSYQRRGDSRRRHSLIALLGALLTSILTSVHGAEVSLAWDPAEGDDVVGYRVHYGSASGAYDHSMDVGNATTATVPNLNNGTTYFIAVTASNSAGLESLPSNEISFTPTTSSPSSLSGKYAGLSSPGASGENIYLSIDLSASGRFTGRVFIGTLSYPLKGSFGDSGDASLPISGTSWAIQLHADPMTGTISATVANGTDSIELQLAASSSDPEDLASLSGKYTALIGRIAVVTGDDAIAPNGWGYALLKITRKGVVRLRGRLADGQSFSAGARLGTSGAFLVHTLTYRGKGGLIAGSVAVREIPGISDGDGTLWWSRPSSSAGASFSGTASVIASRWVKAPLAQTLRATPPTMVRATLTAGELPESVPSIEKDLSADSGTRLTVVSPSDDRLRLAVRGGTGLVQGSFVHPVDQRRRSIQGVIFAKQGSGAGFFAGIATGGRFELTAGTPQTPQANRSLSPTNTTANSRPAIPEL
jgi:hypothetical protein